MCYEEIEASLEVWYIQFSRNRCRHLKKLFQLAADKQLMLKCKFVKDAGQKPVSDSPGLDIIILKMVDK
jgi:hypothetical protein